MDSDYNLRTVFVSGEISNFTNHYRTGHFYMTLKDEKAAVRAVMFKYDNERLGFMPENGMKVIARGRASVFERDGQYQLYIEDMQPDGASALSIAFEQLKKFVSRVDEADRFDEQHLLPIATEIFGTNSFPMHTEYIALPKRRNSRILVTARRMTFESYYSFVLTDFFEGLHHGHYPRQCEVCKQYFLMQNARRQKYCTYGTAPELYHGEKISCRRYAIIQGKAERAKDNPLKAAYDRRCSAIRSEKSRGTISAEFAQAAQEMAKRRLEQAEEDDAYAKANYFTDLERTKLYADTDKRMK